MAEAELSELPRAISFKSNEVVLCFHGLFMVRPRKDHSELKKKRKHRRFNGKICMWYQMMEHTNIVFILALQFGPASFVKSVVGGVVAAGVVTCASR